MINLLSQSLILVTLLANFLLGLVVLKNNIKGKVNIAFSIICFMLSAWGLFLFLYGTPIFLSSYFWIKATYALVTVQISFILGFSFIFPKPIYRNLRLPALAYSLFFIGISYFWLFSTDDWIVTVTTDPISGIQTVLGNAYKFWSIFVWISFGWALFNFIKNSRKSATRERIQLQYLFFGFGLWGVFVSIPDIILPLFFNETRFFPLSVVTSLFFSVAVSYAIIKHHFMDIRLVVARSVAYILLIVILGTFYTLGLFLAGTYLIKQTTNLTSLFVSTILALFMAFTFQPLKGELEKWTDSIFYKGHYDSDRLLATISKIMSTHIDLRPISTQILQTLIEQMKVSKGAFVVLGEEEKSIYEMVSLGFSHQLLVSFNQLSPFFPLSQILVFDEMEENSLKNVMREMDISAIKVLKVKEEVVGILLLGEKASGEIYSQQDLDILEILAPEVAVAIQNSLSYEKIKKFNITLSQEVQKATIDLQAANNRLKQLDQLKDDFVSIASHELRTPMTAIRSYAWMALHRSDVPLSQTLEKYITRILISTERLINLVNDMLNVSRIESGRIEINPEPVDLLSLAKDIVDEVYYSRSLEKQIQFVVVDKPIPKVLADPEKLREVFLNLVGNSLKFTPSGGKITFDFFTDGKVVETLVSDTGVGIPKEDLSKLFHKFSRLDNSYTAAATSGGTGLGLYISKNLVELMHGKIWARSEGVGKGTTFTVSLPVSSDSLLRDIEKYKVKPIGEAKRLEPVAI